MSKVSRREFVRVLEGGALLHLLSAAPVAGESRNAAVAPTDVYLIPFAHYDLAWTGTTPECLSRAYRILTEAIERCEAGRNGWRYLVDNMFYFQRYLAAHPEKLDLCRTLVRRGQLELNPLWIVSFQDNHPGENYVRYLLYPKMFIRDTFGVDPTVVCMSDTPEWSPQFPQIAAGCGIKFIARTRCGPKDTRLFWWQAADGTSVQTAYCSEGYGWLYIPILAIQDDARQTGSGMEFFLAEAFRPAKPPVKGARSAIDFFFAEAGKRSATLHLLSFFGVDRNLPPRELESNVVEWNKTSERKMRISSLSEYYENVRDASNLPVYSGEVPNAWMGIESAFAVTFQDAQKASNLLLTAEKLATISHLLISTPYPQERIRTAWKSLALADDHGWGGHGYEEGDKRKIDERQKAIYAAEEIIEESLIPIAERVETEDVGCIPIVVFNPLSWERNEIVSAHFTLQLELGRELDLYPVSFRRKEEMVLKDDNGRPVPFQVVQKNPPLEYYIVFPGRHIPPLGYRTYYLYPCKEEQRIETDLQVAETALENEYLRVIVDKRKGSISIFDKAAQTTISDGIRISVVDDLRPIGLGKQLEDLPEEPVRVRQVIIAERGPVRGTLRLICDCRHSSLRDIEMTVSLARAGRNVEIESIIGYKMQPRQEVSGVFQVFPFCAPPSEVRYGIPYGHNDMGGLMPTAGFLGGYVGLGGRVDPTYPPQHFWKRARLIQRWLDIGDGKRGVTISSTRHLFIVSEADAQCSLLQLNPGAFYFCKASRAGSVASRFSIAARSKTWQESKAYRGGHELTSPLIPYSVNDTVTKKTLPKALSFLQLSSDHCIVTVLKKAEKGEGVVVRMFEAEGREGRAELAFFRTVQEAWDCNLLEEGEKKADLRNVELKKNQIKTLRLLVESSES